MSGEKLTRLEKLQDDINGAYGVWGTDELADASSAAADVSGFEGQPGTLQQMAADHDHAWNQAQQALQVVYQLRAVGISQVWAGDTHIAANEALDALTDDIVRGMDAIKIASDRLRAQSEIIDQYGAYDLAEIPQLRDAAAKAREMTALGLLPDVLSYDGDVMRAIHATAMAAVDGRVRAHIQMRNSAEDFTRDMNDLASQARASRLGASPLSALDEVVISDAGDAPGEYDRILTPAMNDRAAAAMSAMNDADRRRMTELLAAAGSPEHRAYLLRTLAAGYGMDEVARFNSLVAAHGDDPAWLDEHLSPIDLDGTRTEGKRNDQFKGADWTQGKYPTCVAASTINARAEVDPLYALGLTTGGHPDDPAYDNPQAFAERLLAEQTTVYEDKRTWWQDFEDNFKDEEKRGGLDGEQSAELATAELGSQTGTQYDNVPVKDTESRRAALTSITQAIDEGHPVPLSVHETGQGAHQMMIIGHSGDQLQIHNPWGYTYWINEDDFINGTVDTVDPELPNAPTSVRIPVAAGS